MDAHASDRKSGAFLFMSIAAKERKELREGIPFNWNSLVLSVFFRG